MKCVYIYVITKLFFVLVFAAIIIVNESVTVYGPGYLGNKDPEAEKELKFNLHVHWVSCFTPNANYGKGAYCMQCLDY